MTLTDRFLFRTLRFAPAGFALLFAIASAAGLFGPGGHALFFWIVFFPLLLLAIAGTNRAFGRRRRTQVSMHVVKAPPKPTFLNATCLLYGGLYGLALLIALIVFAGLTNAHPNLWQKLVFVALVLSGPAGTAYYFIVRPLRRYGGYLRGQTLIFKAKYAEARDVMLRNAARRPQDAMAWNGAAWAHQIWWEESEALACAHRAVQLCRDADSCFMRGQALARLGASEEALADLRESDRLKPAVNTNTAIGALLTDQRRLTPPGTPPPRCLPSCATILRHELIHYIEVCPQFTGLNEDQLMLAKEVQVPTQRFWRDALVQFIQGMTPMPQSGQEHTLVAESED